MGCSTSIEGLFFSHGDGTAECRETPPAGWRLATFCFIVLSSHENVPWMYEVGGSRREARRPSGSYSLRSASRRLSALWAERYYARMKPSYRRETLPDGQRFTTVGLIGAIILVFRSFAAHGFVPLGYFPMEVAGCLSRDAARDERPLTSKGTEGEWNGKDTCARSLSFYL